MWLAKTCVIVTGRDKGQRWTDVQVGLPKPPLSCVVSWHHLLPAWCFLFRGLEGQICT